MEIFITPEQEKTLIKVMFALFGAPIIFVGLAGIVTFTSRLF